MRSLIDFLIALQWKHSHLLDTKQPKFTKLSTTKLNSLVRVLKIKRKRKFRNKTETDLAASEQFSVSSDEDFTLQLHPSFHQQIQILHPPVVHVHQLPLVEEINFGSVSQ